MATGNKAADAVAGLPPLVSGGTPAAGAAIPNTANMSSIRVPMMLQDGVMKTYSSSDAKKFFDILPDNIKSNLYSKMDGAYGKGKWTRKDALGVWEKSVDTAGSRFALYGTVVTPMDAFEGIVGNLAANGLNGSGTVSRTTTAKQTSINLTDPSSARALVNKSINDYLGRKATEKEQAEFLKALNAQEKASPTVTTQTTTAGGSSSTTKSKTVGGFNASTFAEEYAAGQEGAGEFQAATSLLDSFIGALGAKV